jgi:hypothetical protein
MQKKPFVKIQHSFMLKTLNKLGREENRLNIKVPYEKVTTNIILISEQVEGKLVL